MDFDMIFMKTKHISLSVLIIIMHLVVLLLSVFIFPIIFSDHAHYIFITVIKIHPVQKGFFLNQHKSSKISTMMILKSINNVIIFFYYSNK